VVCVAPDISGRPAEILASGDYVELDPARRLRAAADKVTFEVGQDRKTGKSKAENMLSTRSQTSPYAPL
jgi:hypothetical protein